jgi:hydrogenase maturation factor
MIFGSDDHSCRQGTGDYGGQNGKKLPEVVQDLSDIVAAAAKDSKYRIAPSSFEGASGKSSVCLHVSDLGLDGAAPSEERLQSRGEPSS